MTPDSPHGPRAASVAGRRRTTPPRGRVAETRPDEALVALAIDGDRKAFEALVRRHQRPLANHLFRHTGQRETAVELAQEVFLKVYLSLASFDPKYRFTTWLYRIASNSAIDHLRKRRPHTCSFDVDGDREDGPTGSRTIAEAGPGPDEMLRFRELSERLEDAIAGLPADYRQLILLRHNRHCRYDEIARITELPIGTVKNRIFRAREMLKRRLSDLLGRESP